MDTVESVRLMIERAGVTPYRVAVDMGRAPTYVSSMLRRGSVPSADLLAQIADACGYDLRLIARDGLDSITVDSGHAD